LFHYDLIVDERKELEWSRRTIHILVVSQTMVINMPRAIIGDTSRTKSYILKVSEIPGFSLVLAHFYKPIENRCIHEGRVVDQLYYKYNGIERLFTNVRFNCLFEINEPIVPRFILDFYSQVNVQTDEYGYLLISFMIQHEFITLSLAQFSQILRIPYNGQVVFTNECDLASLVFFQETEGPYHTDLPTLDDIRRFLQLERVESNRTIKSKNVILTPNQILTKELRQDMKRWEELIRENVFGLGGHRGHLLASLAHMVMRPLALKQTQKPQSDHGMPKACHSISSSSAYHYGSSSHHGDDNEDDDASRAITPSPTTYLNSLLPLNYQRYDIPTSSQQEDDLLFDRQTTLLNQTQKMHEEVRGGFKPFRKALKGVFSKKKK
ncbi:pentatricopeptide repeat-containing protein, partial [Tanacetum coccineum]